MQNPSDGKSALGLDVNVASLLAYIPLCLVGIVVSIIILVTDKTNKAARFHAFQSIILHVLFIVGYFVAMFIGIAAAAANSTIIGLLSLAVWVVVIFGLLAVFVFCMIKAYQGQMLKLPVIGDMADKWSN